MDITEFEQNLDKNVLPLIKEHLMLAYTNGYKEAEKEWETLKKFLPHIQKGVENHPEKLCIMKRIIETLPEKIKSTWFHYGNHVLFSSVFIRSTISIHPEWRPRPGHSIPPDCTSYCRNGSCG